MQTPVPVVGGTKKERGKHVMRDADRQTDTDDQTRKKRKKDLRRVDEERRGENATGRTSEHGWRWDRVNQSERSIK